MFCFRHIFKLEIFLFPGYVFDVESILNSWETAEGRARRRCSFLSRFDVCGFRRPVHRSYYDLSGAIYWWIWVTLLHSKNNLIYNYYKLHIDHWTIITNIIAIWILHWSRLDNGLLWYTLSFNFQVTFMYQLKLIVVKLRSVK